MHQFSVKGMTCAHCVSAIKAAIQTQDAEAKVQVDLDAGEVQVESMLSEAVLKALVTEAGYVVE
ncbi:heavy-metal-associated domain-containing protein [Atopomonas sediminilitoris]|uniref:heavy-metal-associated domain-containing protein n=1 Tax=Atopomonas sediminilitoris TaxID=2919919 RepID=UPI001F4DC7D0|nr:heavy-metal-associated domain-containing protein [Atopomonas sediminilitoris]MCJ8170739.1 heavy-metal-associated domain-containing protein [Atopomonas sediminilitoris]